MDLSAYSGEQSIEFDNNYKALKIRLDSALHESARASDHRMAKDILIMAQAAFKEFKLRREDREEQYARLQEAFEKLNKKIAEERANFESESVANFSELKLKVEEAIYQAGKAQDSRESKSYLIEAQNSFRGLRLVKEQREELYNKLQQAFTEVNSRQQMELQVVTEESQLHYFKLKPKIDDLAAEMHQDIDRRQIREKLIDLQSEIRNLRLTKEHKDALIQQIQQIFDGMDTERKRDDEAFRSEADINNTQFIDKVAKVKDDAIHTTDFRSTRELLKALQTDLRDSRLLWDHKDKLFAELQEAFTILNTRQDEERKTFESEAILNYERLKKRVNLGFKQAQESTEYKETREFLKKIQGEFKGIKMVREQREELYARLQTAFETLQMRLDVYFREKQKNWEVRMTFKLKDLVVTAEDLKNEIEKDEETLDELENQLEIVLQKPLEVSARISLEARIQSLRHAIAEKQIEKAETETEIENLHQRLFGEENVE